MAHDELIVQAVDARRFAYAPYSEFLVGAALRLKDGRVVTGVNVENASYGLGVCAERNAVAAAVRAGAHRGDIVAVAVAVEADAPAAPCGACRQVLVEFVAPDAVVLMANVRDGARREVLFRDLLPLAFTPSSLPT